MRVLRIRLTRIVLRKNCCVSGRVLVVHIVADFICYLRPDWKPVKAAPVVVIMWRSVLVRVNRIFILKGSYNPLDAELNIDVNCCRMRWAPYLELRVQGISLLECLPVKAYLCILSNNYELER